MGEVGWLIKLGSGANGLVKGLCKIEGEARRWRGRQVFAGEAWDMGLELLLEKGNVDSSKKTSLEI